MTSEYQITRRHQLSPVMHMIFSSLSHEILKNCHFFLQFPLLFSASQAMSALVTIKVMHTCLLPAWCHVFCQSVIQYSVFLLSSNWLWIASKNRNVIHENLGGGFLVCSSKGLERCWVWQGKVWALGHRGFVSVCASSQPGCEEFCVMS